MDLMYLPDTFTFHVSRSPSYDYRDHLDTAWEEEGRRRTQKVKRSSPPFADAGGDVTHGGGHHRTASVGGKKGECPMCKERKRRTLATYIRTKSRQDSECTIEEEEEDGGLGEGGEESKEGNEGHDQQKEGSAKEGNSAKSQGCDA